ncbi:MAG: flagellar protein FliS [Sphingomonadaceae bacterium]|nr:flagellar protein FliS [Sphingomonadaceae bacterium]
MLAYSDPGEAYRRSEVDARIRSARPEQLVTMCCEQVSVGIGSAIAAELRGDATARSRGLTRALSALTALEMGVDRNQPLADVLTNMYANAKRAILDNVVSFDRPTLDQVRTDFAELSEVFASLKHGA